MSSTVVFLVASTLAVAFAAPAAPSTEEPTLDLAQGASSTPTYQGCFVDDSSRILRIFSKQSSMMSIPMCTAEVCSGFKYAGVEGGVWCFCGNDLFTTDTRKKVDDSQCNIQCHDSVHFPGTKCGGAWRINIYQLK